MGKIKRGNEYTYQFLFVFALLSLTMFASRAAAVTVSARYLYTLSDFTGAIPYGGGRVVVDRQRNEAYVVYQNTVRIFNDNGLEVYRFGDGNALGLITDLAVDENGDILALSYKEGGGSFAVIRADFRGEPKATIEITGLPADFTKFLPTDMVYRDGRIYLVDAGSLKIVVTDRTGSVQKTYDVAKVLELGGKEKSAKKEKDGADEKETEKDRERKRELERGDVMMSGFSVDKDGNMMFTIPVFFSASVLTPDGKIQSFGEAGSIPGKFSVTSSIIEDNKGNYLVADKLKCVINVFDRNFNFLMEFGHRGDAPDNLIVPMEMAIDSDDRLYIVQAGNRGVSVFRLFYN